MINNFLLKNKEKLRKKNVRNIKIFPEKEKTKVKKRPKKDIKIQLKKKRQKSEITAFSEEQKNKLAD